jgi:hypothetical protein
MHFSIYDVFYSQIYHQHVSAGISAILRVINPNNISLTHKYLNISYEMF